jgi:hypothetical protein
MQNYYAEHNEREIEKERGGGEKGLERENRERGERE